VGTGACRALCPPYKDGNARHKAGLDAQLACCRVRFRTSGARTGAYLSFIEIASRQ
jgi:hypothetical protein